MRQNGSGEWKIQRLDEGGPILGAIPSSNYRQGQARVLPGDLLILYSDGLVEASNDKGEEFGEERIWTAARNHWTRSASEIRDAILSEVRGFVPDHRPEDDVTLVVMRMRNGTSLSAIAEEPEAELHRYGVVHSTKNRTLIGKVDPATS